MRLRIVVVSVVALALVITLAGCSSASPKGSLKVTVSGLPAGVDAQVKVTGPGGYAKTVTGTTTLSVAPGTYAVAADPARNGDAVVATLYAGSASPASVTVTANATSSSSASYALRTGSGHLWIPIWTPGGSTNEVEGYAASDLASSGSPSADVALATSANRGEAAVVDGAGNLWAIDQGGTIFRFDAAQLATSGSPTPSVTIDASAYSRLYGAAFDASGDLWTCAIDADELIMFTPAQLAAGGTVTPAVVIDANGPSLVLPYALAFDASGDLWVANLTGSSVVKFTPSQLASSGSPVQSVRLGAAVGGISKPDGLAFDAAGNLWVANLDGSVERFDASQLTSSGHPVAAAAIGAAGGTNPTGLAIDASGALWVLDENGGSPAILRRFTSPDSLSGSVSPSPDVTLTGLGEVDGGDLAFDPPPAGLPINTP